MAQWLCQKLNNLGMSVDIYDKDGCALIQNAYVNGQAKIVKILLKYTTVPNLHKWLVQRQLICILGANFLLQNNISITEQQAKAAEGGFSKESLHVLCSAISELLETNSQYAEIEEDIINFYHNNHSKCNDFKLADNLINRANQKNNPRVLFNAGCIGHTFAAAIKKQEDGTYQLSFYDGNSPQDDLKHQLKIFATGQVAIVRRINVPAEQLEAVVRNLLLNRKKPSEAAYDWLESLPQKLNNPYKYEQSLLLNVDKHEENRCYWQNPKYAVMDLFIDKFGVEAGTREFNNFLTSINVKVLENFKSAFKGQYNEPAIGKLESAVRDNTIIKPPTSRLEAILNVATMLAGVGLIITSSWAAMGIAGFTTIAALLGPIGIGVAAIVGITLAFHQWILPVVLDLYSAAKRFIKGEKTVALITEDNSKVYKLSDPSNSVKADPQPERPPSPLLETVMAKDSKKSSKFSLPRLFHRHPKINPASEKQQPLLAKEAWAKEQPVEVIQDDLKKLWKLPRKLN